MTRSPARGPGAARLDWTGHRATLIALGVPLILVDRARTAWNLQGWPGRVDDDEGTYVAEAWAMVYPAPPRPTTPTGTTTRRSAGRSWPAYIWLTDGFALVSRAPCMVGREFMLVRHAGELRAALRAVPQARLPPRPPLLVTVAAVRPFSPLADLLPPAWSRWTTSARCGCSPRWSTAASRRRNLSAGVLGRRCAWPVAVLSKETTGDPAASGGLDALAAPAEPRTRKWHLGVFAVDLRPELSRLLPAVRRAARRAVSRHAGTCRCCWALWWQLMRQDRAAGACSRSGSARPRPADAVDSAPTAWLLYAAADAGAGRDARPVRLRPFACRPADPGRRWH